MNWSPVGTNILPPIPASSYRPQSPSSVSSKRPSERGVSPASSAGSHVSGASHPPGSRKRRRTTIVTDVSSDKLLNSIDDWDDGYSLLESLSSPSNLLSASTGRSTTPDTSFMSLRRLNGRSHSGGIEIRTSGKTHSHDGSMRRASYGSWSKSTRRTRDQRRRPPDPTDGADKMSISSILNPNPSGEGPQSKTTPQYKCVCCPLKPKTFDRKFLLRAHSHKMKQYWCQYCPQRCKTEEALIWHMGLMHAPSRLWACHSGTGYKATFLPSRSSLHANNTESLYDWCGYCGMKFPNFPQPQWALRREHLTKVHNFGECNITKKFFREDHFRQHIQHSHNATTGEWTADFVKACMREKSPTVPRDQNHATDTAVDGHAVSDIKVKLEESGLETASLGQRYPSLSFLLEDGATATHAKSDVKGEVVT